MDSPIDIKGRSLNVRGLNKCLKRRAVLRWLHKTQLLSRFFFFFYKKLTAQKNVKTPDKQNAKAKYSSTMVQNTSKEP